MKLSNFSLDFFFKRYAEYIGKDAKVETLLILMIMSSDLVELTISEYYSIYLFALLLEVAFNCNTLFLWAVWTMAPNWVFSVLTLAASALSCNKKWKIYLFMFVSIVSMGKESKNSHLITALASLFLTVLSYSSLIF